MTFPHIYTPTQFPHELRARADPRSVKRRHAFLFIIVGVGIGAGLHAAVSRRDVDGGRGLFLAPGGKSHRKAHVTHGVTLLTYLI